MPTRGQRAAPRRQRRAARVSAIIAVNFSDKQFQPETIAAWLAFYVEAQKSPPLRRLLQGLRPPAAFQPDERLSPPHAAH